MAASAQARSAFLEAAVLEKQNASKEENKATEDFISGKKTTTTVYSSGDYVEEIVDLTPEEKIAAQKKVEEASEKSLQANARILSGISAIFEANKELQEKIKGFLQEGDKQSSGALIDEFLKANGVTQETTDYEAYMGARSSLESKVKVNTPESGILGSLDGAVDSADKSAESAVRTLNFIGNKIKDQRAKFQEAYTRKMSEISHQFANDDAGRIRAETELKNQFDSQIKNLGRGGKIQETVKEALDSLKAVKEEEAKAYITTVS